MYAIVGTVPLSCSPSLLYTPERSPFLETYFVFICVCVPASYSIFYSIIFMQEKKSDI